MVEQIWSGQKRKQANNFKWCETGTWADKLKCLSHNVYKRNAFPQCRAVTPSSLVFNHSVSWTLHDMEHSTDTTSWPLTFWKQEKEAHLQVVSVAFRGSLLSLPTTEYTLTVYSVMGLRPSSNVLVTDPSTTSWKDKRMLIKLWTRTTNNILHTFNSSWQLLTI